MSSCASTAHRQGPERCESAPAETGGQLTAEAVDQLFRVWRRVYGYRWRDQAEDQHSRPTWLRALRALGMTDELLRVGLRRSLELAWPPSPGELAELARQADCPPDHDAMAEAGRWARSDQDAASWDWSSPLVCAAALSVGSWALRHLPEVDLRRAWAQAYGAAKAAAARGEPVTVPPRALPREPEVPVRTEQGQREGIAALEAMGRELFGWRPPKGSAL